MSSLFRRRANRFLVFFADHGFVPLADREKDDIPVLITGTPVRVGDDALVAVEGQLRKVRLLRSAGSIAASTYLVDMGAA